MNHYMDFDPYVIRERNEQIHREVNSLQLEKRLRKSRKPHGMWIVALGKWGRILVGRAKLTQNPGSHGGAMVDGTGIGERFGRPRGSSGLHDAAPAVIRDGTRRLGDTQIHESGAVRAYEIRANGHLDGGW